MEEEDVEQLAVNDKDAMECVCGHVDACCNVCCACAGVMSACVVS